MVPLKHAPEAMESISHWINAIPFAGMVISKQSPVISRILEIAIVVGGLMWHSAKNDIIIQEQMKAMNNNMSMIQDAVVDRLNEHNLEIHSLQDVVTEHRVNEHQ